MINYIKTTAVWFVLACLVFNIIVILLFRGGFVKKTRNVKGELKKKQSFVGVLIMFIFVCSIIYFLYSYSIAVFSGVHQTFLNILLVNFVMVMLLVAYDSFVIDLLVIGIIRPRILLLPSKMNLVEMKKHVKRTYIIGWIYIVPITIVPSIVYYLTQLSS